MPASLRLLAALTVVGALLLPGRADAIQVGDHGSADRESGEISAWVGSGPSSRNAWTRPSSGVTCEFYVPAGTPDEVYRVIDGVDYILHFRECSNGTLAIIWVPQLDARDLADLARDEVRRQLPLPKIGLAPPAGQVVVQVGTWLWADPTVWQPVTATASIPGLTATVTAVPTKLRFDPGDGGLGTGALTCDGPGQVWRPEFGDDRPSTCMYTYRHSSSLSPTGTWTAATSIEWAVTYTVSDGTTGNLGTLTTRSTQPITVGEIQALVTG